MRRSLVLFAREPARQALEKGFATEEAADLFEAFAVGWRDAAHRAGAAFIVATPPEDRAAWGRRLGGSEEPVWIAQRGSTFGRRLENTARRAARLGGRAILVGGDVPPAPRELLEAFEVLDRGVDAVIAPAQDGGVSLLALATKDLDLLSGIGVRRRDVFENLVRTLAARGRRIKLLDRTPDVDGRRGLLTFARGHVTVSLAPLIRRALRVDPAASGPRNLPPPRDASVPPSGLRAPPDA
jgi:glycosyltransferase A (GT-A) superfamily protein (DUF2064 family)